MELVGGDTPCRLAYLHSVKESDVLSGSLLSSTATNRREGDFPSLDDDEVIS